MVKECDSSAEDKGYKQYKNRKYQACCNFRNFQQNSSLNLAESVRNSKVSLLEKSPPNQIQGHL